MLFQRSTFAFRTVLLSSVAALLVSTLPARTSTEPPENLEQIVEKLSDLPTTLTGTYLSARLAQDEEDLRLAAHFYAQALAKEPDNPVLLERNFALTLATGRHDVAFELADKLAAQFAQKEAARKEAEAKKAQEEQKAKEADEEKNTPANTDSAKDDAEENKSDAEETTEQTDSKSDTPETQETKTDKKDSALDRSEHMVAPMVHLAQGVKALKSKAYAGATQSFEAGLTELTEHPVNLLGPGATRRGLNSPKLLSASAQYGPFAMITQTVLKAWSQIGQDRKALDKVLVSLETIDRSEVNQFFYSLHSGLIASYAKDYEKAVDFLQKSLAADPNSAPTAEALLNVLVRMGEKEKAKEVLATFMSSTASQEEKTWLQKVYSPLEPVASYVRTPQDGAAELFSTLGDALAQENALQDGALYLQFADYLRDEHPRTQYALARLSERMGHDEDALAYFDKVRKDSAIYRKAQRQSGFTLSRLKRSDDAIARLQALLETKPGDLETISVLARVFQSEKKYYESIGVLTAGIDGIEKKRDIHWSLYFLRGSAYDQVKNWPNTEKDMKSALSLFPNQPTVLNYLGYSWVDRGLNLDEAIEMIRQAVALRPYDGFFVDSLGWAHYRLEQYSDAVIFLERAVELRPEDPVITDHLGDAYWKAGRKNEAKFQWQRVKTMKPKDELLEEIKTKLKDGLEALEKMKAEKKDAEK